MDLAELIRQLNVLARQDDDNLAKPVRFVVHAKGRPWYVGITDWHADVGTGITIKLQ